jgi:hypothetical protein
MEAEVEAIPDRSYEKGGEPQVCDSPLFILAGHGFTLGPSSP